MRTHAPELDQFLKARGIRYVRVEYRGSDGRGVSDAIEFSRADGSACLSTSAQLTNRSRTWEGCIMDEMKWYAFVFGQRGLERICLAVEAIEPGSSTVGHGTHLGGNASRK
jgi:hypothetical protein